MAVGSGRLAVALWPPVPRDTKGRSLPAGQFLCEGPLVDVDGRLQTRQWDDDDGKRHWITG